MEAEYNVINYREYLPTILNKHFMKFFDLNLKPDDQFSKYNEWVNPGIIQEFGVGAFRYSHSNINSNFPIVKRDCLKNSNMKLRFNYGNMAEIWDGNVILIFPKLITHCIFIFKNIFYIIIGKRID